MLRLLPLLFCSLAVPLSAQTPPPAEIQELETVVVSGAVPGPGLWRASRDGHTLWILGTMSPLPKNIEWETGELEDIVSTSQAVLLAPSLRFDAEMGTFRKLLLAPRLIGLRKEPDKKPLRETLPPDLYARWLRVKTPWLGRARKVEKYRPFFAAMELGETVVDKSGLTYRDLADGKVRKLAQAHDIPLVPVRLTIMVDNPKQAIREFRASRLDDVKCMEETLDRIEEELPQMQAAANAWATGDIDVLREHHGRPPRNACFDAISGVSIARQQGVDNVRERLRELWLEAAEQAIAENASTLALVPMGSLLGPRSVLDVLTARGYAIDPP